MKKKLLISIILIIFCLLILNNNITLAQTEDIENLNNQVEKVSDISKKITDEEIRNDYLNREWIEFIKKTKLYSYLKLFETTIEPLNPIIAVVMGTKFSLTLYFLTIFIIWIAIFVYSIRILTFFEIISKTLKFLISTGIPIFLAIVGIIPSIGNLIVKFITSFDELWKQIIAFITFIIIIAYFSLFSKIIQKISKSLKNKLEQKKLIRDVKELKKDEEDENKYQKTGKQVLEAIGKEISEEYKK